MRSVLILLACCVATSCGLASMSHAADSPRNEAKIQNLLKQMTLDEKLDLLSGTGMATKAIPRLGIPAVEMSDGPQGVRGGRATAFPAGICIAATWNPTIVNELGKAIGRETIAKEGAGADIILGPCVNINRTPLGGRNCESYSEDPYLAARTAVAYIKGVQSQGAASCVKHYACNNQETERGSINVLVDERALREIYLPAFEAAAKEAHVLSLMTSYNCVNGQHSSANNYLVNEILKKEWGWDGLVMSDWGGVHETAAVINAGNDLEMPGGEHLIRAKLQDAINKGKVSVSTIDESVTRILRLAVRLGLLDGPKNRDRNVLNCPAHRETARKVASEGIVLLKNNREVLPLNKNKIKSIAIIGSSAEVLRSSVLGSGTVPPVDPVTPLDSIRKLVNGKITVNYAPGVSLEQGLQMLPLVPDSAVTSKNENGFFGEYFAGQNFKGTPAFTRIDKAIDFSWKTGQSPAENFPFDNFSIRWTSNLTPTESGKYKFELWSDDGAQLFIDNVMVIDNGGSHANQVRTGSINLQAGHSYVMRLEYHEYGGDASVRLGWRIPSGGNVDNSLIPKAVDAAAKSDVAVVFAGVWDNHEGEGVDRTDFDLPDGQDELISKVAAVNKNTVVVLSGGTTSDLTKWMNSVPSVLESWYPGVMGGAAITDILFGNVNPSGKLPCTFGRVRTDYSDLPNFPGSDGQVKYAEGIFVGYRHFDKAGITPLFPFGHGLSYTTFKYSDLSFSSAKMHRGGKVKVNMTVANTGKREGSEVVQLYVGEIKPTVPRPVRELKGFRKVALKPGEKKLVSFEIDESALSFYDVAGKRWKANSGKYEISVGSSSRDLRLKKTIELD